MKPASVTFHFVVKKFVAFDSITFQQLSGNIFALKFLLFREIARNSEAQTFRHPKLSISYTA
jgi:hypothetical protein